MSDNNNVVIALAGNPNVGKSTIFNKLTGMKQHTGNWPGKTVANARGFFISHGKRYEIVDVPGAYSLSAHSTEEEIARDFICFGEADSVIVVCDATCLERNLNLVLQVLETTSKVVVCINLMDEAIKKRIEIDLKKLEDLLGVRVVATQASNGSGMKELAEAAADAASEPERACRIICPERIEQAVEKLASLMPEGSRARSKWIAMRLMIGDISLELSTQKNLPSFMQMAEEALLDAGISRSELEDEYVYSLIKRAEEISKSCVSTKGATDAIDRKIDRILTSKWLGLPIMLILLGIIFWITIVGANYPSQWLATMLSSLEEKLLALFAWLNAPDWLSGMIVGGAYRVLSWVVSVMLPPMAIFFPLFTILEDFGYLPRVAFNLDSCFKKCSACGKQALTMAMGFGCNAAGVIGCRIIDSPRERLIAIMTNNFVPCNGRFPTILAVITMFFSASYTFSAGSAAIMTLVITCGILLTLGVSKLLSMTILKGVPSSFTLELPPYRKPQVGEIIVRSIFDRTLFVLGRAVISAIPAGIIIWLMTNIHMGDSSLLQLSTGFLNPFAKLLGMDGVILISFILGFPANEIVIPIMIMAYISSGTLTDLSSLPQLKELLIANNWTWLTGICTMTFSLAHWPCSTTCITIYKETRSLRWTLLSIAAPTATGMLLCFLLKSGASLLGF
ncbi:MAG: ferrous iron transport protein B [Clostridiales bacterium]|jgi:ferrous iron transport protein B|nr:ferrous iron transport protein B [Clostridiales bacterium]